MGSRQRNCERGVGVIAQQRVLSPGRKTGVDAVSGDAREIELGPRGLLQPGAQATPIGTLQALCSCKHPDQFVAQLAVQVRVVHPDEVAQVSERRGANIGIPCN